MEAVNCHPTVIFYPRDIVKPFEGNLEKKLIQNNLFLHQFVKLGYVWLSLSGLLTCSLKKSWKRDCNPYTCKLWGKQIRYLTPDSGSPIILGELLRRPHDLTICGLSIVDPENPACNQCRIFLKSSKNLKLNVEKIAKAVFFRFYAKT